MPHWREKWRREDELDWYRAKVAVVVVMIAGAVGTGLHFLVEWLR